MVNKREKDISSIIVKYEDGTEKEILKGAVITLADNEELTFEFCDMSGKDVVNIVLGTTQMGVELGLFNE